MFFNQCLFHRTFYDEENNSKMYILHIQSSLYHEEVISAPKVG